VDVLERQSEHLGIQMLGDDRPIDSPYFAPLMRPDRDLLLVRIAICADEDGPLPHRVPGAPNDAVEGNRGPASVVADEIGTQIYDSPVGDLEPCVLGRKVRFKPQTNGRTPRTFTSDEHRPTVDEFRLDTETGERGSKDECVISAVPAVVVCAVGTKGSGLHPQELVKLSSYVDQGRGLG